MYTISIHALREEGDLRKRKDWSTRMISIHALREEGDYVILVLCISLKISIHALREEGDPRLHRRGGLPCNFYPRPPRGGRPAPLVRSAQLGYFYPRPPRGGRPGSPLRITPQPYFYPRPPRGGRRYCHRLPDRLWPISIHALREEGDLHGHLLLFRS